MRLGLARHFQIPHDRFSLMNGDGFMEWARWYDTTDVKSRPVPAAGEAWDKCYCSDLPRAQFTARYLFSGEIETTPLLREVPFSGFLPRKAKLPLFLWQSTSRVGWWLNHASQSETRRQTLERIADFTRLLKDKHRPGERILIVSHGWYMQYFEKALNRTGFRGSVPMRPRGGIIYPFELR